MPELPGLVADLFDRADHTLVAGGYHAVSVSAERVRAWLRFRGLPFVDPAKPEVPSLGEIDRTADVVIGRASVLGAAVGGTTSLGGVAGMPSEVALSVVVVLRMSQRLCVVYGFDPATDRGQAALTRALAAAWGVELPQTGAVDLRLSDVPRLLSPGAAPEDVGGRLLRGMAQGTAWWTVGRVSRWIPVLASPRHAVRTHANVEGLGLRLREVLRRLAEVPDASIAPLEDAVEVR